MIRGFQALAAQGRLGFLGRIPPVSAGRGHEAIINRDSQACKLQTQHYQSVSLPIMRSVTVEERQEIARELLGKDGAFSAYFRLYGDLTQRDHDFSIAFDEPTFYIPKTYQDVLLAARKLRENTDITKEEVTTLLQNIWKTSARVENVMNTAVQAMIMVDSAAKDWRPADFILGGYRPISWLPHESLLSLVKRSFPLRPESSSRKIQQAMAQRPALKAWKLQKRLGVCFRSTDNITEHLLLDPKTNTLYVFHHAAYLKAHGALPNRPRAVGN